MKCPACQQDNPPGVSHCLRCAEALVEPADQPSTPPQLLVSPDQRAARRAEPTTQPEAQPASAAAATSADDPSRKLAARIDAAMQDDAVFGGGPVEPADSAVPTLPPRPAADPPVAGKPKAARPAPEPADALETAPVIDDQPPSELKAAEAVADSAADAPADSALDTPASSAPSQDPGDAEPTDDDPEVAADAAAIDQADAPVDPALVSVHRQVRLSPVWRRAAAAALDLLAVALLGALHLGVALSRLPDTLGPARGTGFDRLIDAALVYSDATVPAAVVFVLLLVLYETIFVALLGQTPGHMLLGCHVIATRQRAMTYSRAALRGLLVALGLVALGLGWSLLLVDRRSRALHDRLAGTLVGTATDEVVTLLPQPAEEIDPVASPELSLDGDAPA